MKRLLQKNISTSRGEINRLLVGPAFQTRAPRISKRLPSRIWVELTLGVISAVSLLLAMVVPNWMELLFHFAPDAGDGSAERGFALLWAAISVVMFALAGRTWRKHVWLVRESA